MTGSAARFTQDLEAPAPPRGDDHLVGRNAGTSKVLSLDATERERRRALASQAAEFGSLIGVSAKMVGVFALLEDAARSDAPVLLSGETGTGKDAAAEAIHARSARSNGPFTVVDCASLSSALLESELFGHERGAFTGATGRRLGAFEAAQGGTVFLDEVGEMPLDLQPKLLRVLEHRQVRRIGRNDFTEVDVRVIAATNRDLRGEVTGRRFRSDLYYRLAVLEVEMPALRDRREDILLIATRLLERRGAHDRSIEILRSDEVREKLKHDPWPGNVRELRNYLDRLLARSHGDRKLVSCEAPRTVDASSLGPIDASVPFKAERARWTRSFETRYLSALLLAHGGNVTTAARAAGLDRTYFYRLLWRHGLR
jgi:two-component system, NtrC family, response regulator GlrR